MTINRIHAMDVLRAVAMYLGVILHTAIVYQTNPRPGWPRDGSSSGFFDMIYAVTHSFRMQLFYVVAGFFANLLISRIGAKNFTMHRFKRVFVPFIVSVIVLTPLSSLAFNFYNAKISGLEATQAWTIAFEKAIGWNGLFHLWFLYYLMMFYGISIALNFVKQRVGKELYSIKIGYSIPYTIFYTIILFGITYLFFDYSIEPWTGITPLLNQFLYYGFFYALGFLLYYNLSSLWSDAQYCWGYIIVGVLATVLVELNLIETLGLERGVYLMLLSIQTTFLTFGSLSLFLKYCEKNKAWIRYLSDASYWFYLIHFPLVTMGQVLLLDVEIYGAFKFMIVLSTSTLISFVTYHYMVRYTYIGLMLNGKRLKITT